MTCESWGAGSQIDLGPCISKIMVWAGPQAQGYTNILKWYDHKYETNMVYAAFNASKFMHADMVRNLSTPGNIHSNRAINPHVEI